MSSYHQWRPQPPPRIKRKPPAPSEGTALMTSRAAARHDALKAKDRERIKAEAREAAAEALAAFSKRRGRTT